MKIKTSFLIILLASFFHSSAAQPVPPRQVQPHPPLQGISSQANTAEQIFYRMREEDAPPALEGWRKWVLQGKENTQCAVTSSDYACVGLGISYLNKYNNDLVIRTKAQGLHPDKNFNLLKLFFSKEGDTEVFVDGQKGDLLKRGNDLYLMMEPGDHDIVVRVKNPSDKIDWPQPWGSAFWENGQAVAQQGNTLLWRETAQDVHSENDYIDMKVFRKYTDNPLPEIETRVRIKSAGRPRWETIDYLLPPHYQVVSWKGDLPIVFKKPSGFKIKISSGENELVVVARCQEKCNQSFMGKSKNWPSFEVWSVEQYIPFRQLSFSGQSTDPRQSNVPKEWENLPAYLIKKDKEEALTWKVVARGGTIDPKIEVERRAWFYKGEWIVEDLIKGKVENGTFLHLPTGYTLLFFENGSQGNGLPIVSKKNNMGVNWSGGELNARAVYKTQDLKKALGWSIPADKISERFYLQPNDEILHISRGQQSGTWVSRLSVWSFFWMFVLVGVVRSALGTKMGLLSGVLFISALNGAGIWMTAGILLLCLISAIHNYLPQYQKGLKTIFLLGLIFWGASFVGIAGKWARDVFYPNLNVSVHVPNFDMGKQAGAPMVASLERAEDMMVVSSQTTAPKNVFPSQTSKYIGVVQAGVAVPEWQRNDNQVFTFIEHITPEDTQNIWKIPGGIMALGKLLWLIGMAYLLICLWKKNGGPLDKKIFKKPIFTLSMLMLSVPAFAQTPSADLLEQFRQKATAKPMCAPSCSLAEKASLSVRGNMTVVEIHVLVHYPSTMPLPDVQGLALRAVNVDGRDGTLYNDGVLLDKGRHTVFLSYMGTERGQISFKERPLFIEAGNSKEIETTKDGWSITRDIEEKTLTEESDTPKIFLDIQREITFGNDIENTITLTRIGDTSQTSENTLPVFSNEKLLQGEAETSPKTWKILWRAGEKRRVLKTQIPKGVALSLQAADATQGAERWIVRNTALWSIQPLSQDSHTSLQEKIILPEPSEKITIVALLPDFVKGQVLRIESMHAETIWGQTQTTTQVTGSAMATQASDVSFTLPAHTTLEQITINGRPYPLVIKNNTITLPLPNGSSQFGFSLTTPRQGLVSQTPSIKSDHDISNSQWTVSSPERLFLWTGGGEWGTSVFYWPYLIILSLIGFVIVRVKVLDITLKDAFLLIFGFSFLGGWALIIIGAWKAWMGRGRIKSKKIFAALTVFVGGLILISISRGLIGAAPNMHLAGVGGLPLLTWYHPSPGLIWEGPWAVSVPLWFYRILMCAWGLWVAQWTIKNMQTSLKLIMERKEMAPQALPPDSQDLQENV